MVRKIFSATYTLKRGIAGKIPSYHQSLLGAAHLYRAQDVSQRQILDFNLRYVKGEFTAITNLCMDDEANVNSERFTGIWHGFDLRETIDLPAPGGS